MTWATSASVGMPFSISRSGAKYLAHFALTGSTGIFGAVQDEHLELRGGHIEALGDVLANPMLETATAWAGLVIDIDGDLFARQMRRQRAAIVASLTRQSGRLGLVLLRGGASSSDVCSKSSSASAN